MNVTGLGFCAHCDGWLARVEAEVARPEDERHVGGADV